MLTLNLPRITNYGRQVYLLPSSENELNLFYESMRTIESINDFKRARINYLLVVYSLNYYCNNSLDFIILVINYDSFIYLFVFV